MRTKKFLFISACIFFLLSDYAYGQNYRLIDPDRIRTYTQRDTAENDSAYFFIKVDSTGISGTDTVYYFNRILDTIPKPGCDIASGDTVKTGVKMLIKNDTDATHIFFNKNGDSIFIKTLVNENDAWHLYTWPDGNYVKATVINKLYAGILPGVFDTLYRVKLNVFTLTGTELTDVFPNETKMDFTQNYGLVEFWPFYNFPYDTTALLLRGLTGPDTNIVDVDAQDAFDFNLGDEFHYIDTSFSNGTTYNNEITLYKYFILNKFIFADSVNYTALRAQVQYIDNGVSGLDTVKTYDTVSLHYDYSDYAFLDTIELSPFQNIKYGFSDFVLDSTYKNIAHKYVFDWFDYDAISGCLNNPENIYLPEQLYGDGLGLMHFKDSSLVNYHVLNMVYFHKGLKEWGTPLNFDSLGLALSNFSNTVQIRIYPNPASEIINITVPVNNVEQNQIEIFNVQGELVKSEFFNTQRMIIDISSLQSGYYILKLINQDGRYFTPFIKQ